MKLNPTVVTTFILLACMSSIGIVSGAFGYSFGREALKGVTQPAISPILGGTSRNGKAARESADFLKEAEILKKVKNQTSGVAKATANSTSSPAKAAAKASADNQSFPITVEDQGVTLTIESVQRQADLLRLTVAMKNQSSDPVQFLYTFLDITDGQGRSLTAITQGLPTELMPNGEAVTGTISLPGTSVEDVKQLGLNLTDYPNQELQLKISKIPIDS